MYICLFIVWGHGLCGGQRTTFENGLSIYCGFWELQSGCQFKHCMARVYFLNHLANTVPIFFIHLPVIGHLGSFIS